MRRDIVLRRVAEKEFDDSIAFYESQREGLGREFRATVEEYFQQIAGNPEWFPEVRGEVRRAVVRRFPFVIHFLVEKQRIVVLSVFHTSRNPEDLRRLVK
jgi:plasmid stabilization system protein ParE